MAKRFNLAFEQSATFQHTVNWKDPQGNPIDMTGYRIRMQVRTTASASATVLAFDSADLGEGMQIEGLGEDGWFTITLAPSVTAGLSFDTGVYDVTATSPGGVVYRLHEGKASVLPGVTR